MKKGGGASPAKIKGTAAKVRRGVRERERWRVSVYMCVCASVYNTRVSCTRWDAAVYSRGPADKFKSLSHRHRAETMRFRKKRERGSVKKVEWMLNQGISAVGKLARRVLVSLKECVT